MVVCSGNLIFRCLSFCETFPKLTRVDDSINVTIYSLSPKACPEGTQRDSKWTCFHALICTEVDFVSAKSFWKDFGDGISSRHAEWFLTLLNAGVGTTVLFKHKGKSFTPVSWQKAQKIIESFKVETFPSLFGGKEPKTIIRTHVSRLISTKETQVSSIDVSLYPSEVKAIFDVFRAVRTAFDVMKLVSFLRYQKKNADVLYSTKSSSVHSASPYQGNAHCIREIMSKEGKKI
jgi:hypothetical protein